MNEPGIEGVKIREVATADEGCVIGMLAELQCFEESLSADRDSSEAAARKHFEYLCSQKEFPAGFCLVAEVKEKLVGFLIAAPERLPGFYIKPECRDYGEIHDLYIAPEARRQGLAGRLIKAAEARFQKLGLKRISLYALADNSRAIDAYERLGFNHYEVFMRKNIAE